jgi:hypothetical protein
VKLKKALLKYKGYYVSFNEVTVPQLLAMQSHARVLPAAGPLLTVASANLTVRSAQFLFSPKYSLLVIGIKEIANDHGYLKGLGSAIGTLMILASPTWAAIRLAVGVPGMIIGAAGTVISSLVWGTQSAVQKIQNPSEADTKRKELTELFVRRMHTILNDMPYNKIHYFKEHVDQLITIAFITVGFLSRKDEGKRLLVGGQLLRQSDVNNQDEIQKGYFDSVYEIKQAIRSLRLSDDDEHAWHYLLNLIENPPEDANERETVELLTGYAWTLAEAVTEDTVFQETWKASLNQ